MRTSGSCRSPPGRIEKGYPYDMFAVPLREVVRIHASSGQARKPIVTGYTAGDLKAWARLMARFLVGTGITRDDVIQISFRYGLMTGGFGFHAAAELIGASVIPADIGNTTEQVIIMSDYLTYRHRLHARLCPYPPGQARRAGHQPQVPAPAPGNTGR